ncbi:uncharacterized protein ACN427_010669 [Glossina fuscipes fuscipes]
MDSNKFLTYEKMDDKLSLALKYIGEKEVSLPKHDYNYLAGNNVNDKISTKLKGERTKMEIETCQDENFEDLHEIKTQAKASKKTENANNITSIPFYYFKKAYKFLSFTMKWNGHLKESNTVSSTNTHEQIVVKPLESIHKLSPIAEIPKDADSSYNLSDNKTDEGSDIINFPREFHVTQIVANRNGPEVSTENLSFPVSKNQAENVESPSKCNADIRKATKGVYLELANMDNDGESLEANQDAISSKEFNADTYTYCDSNSYDENSADTSKTARSAVLENICIRETYDFANNLVIKNQNCLIKTLENTIEHGIHPPMSIHSKENFKRQDFGLYARSNKCGTGFPNDKTIKSFESSIGMYGLINTLWNTATRYTYGAVSSLAKANTMWNEAIKKNIVVKTSDDNLNNGKNFQIFANKSPSSSENRSRSEVNLLELLEGVGEGDVPSPAFENIQKYYATATITLQVPSKNHQLRANDINASSINKNFKDGENSTGLVNTIRETTKTSTFRSFYSLTKTTTKLTEIVKKDTIIANSPEPFGSSAVTTLHHDSNDKKTICINLNALKKTTAESSTSPGEFGNIRYAGKEPNIIRTIHVQDPFVSENGNGSNVKRLRTSTGFYGLFNAIKYTTSSYTYCFLSSFKKPATEITEAVTEKSLDSSKPTILSELKIANVNLRNEKTLKIPNNASPPLPNETQFRTKVKLLELLEDASEEDTPSSVFESIKRYRTAATIMIQGPKDKNDQLNEYDVGVSNNNNVEKPDSSTSLHGLVNIIRNSVNCYSYLSFSSFKKPSVEMTEPVKELEDFSTLNTSTNTFCNKKTFKVFDYASSPALSKSSTKDSTTKRYHTAATILLEDHNKNKGIDQDGIDVSNNNCLESTTGLYGLVNTIKKTSYGYCSSFLFKKESASGDEIIKQAKHDADSSTTPASTMVTALYEGSRKKKAAVNFNNVLSLNVMDETPYESEVEAREKVNKEKFDNIPYSGSTMFAESSKSVTRKPEEQTVDLNGSTYSDDNDKQTAETNMSLMETGPVAVDEVVKYKNSSEITTKMPEQQSNDLKQSTNNNDTSKSAAKTDISANEGERILLDEAVEKDNKFTDSSKTATRNPEQQSNDLKEKINSNDNSKLTVTTYTSSDEGERILLDEAVEKDNKFTDSSKASTRNAEQQSNDLKEKINSNDNSKLTVTTYTSSDEGERILLDEAVEKDNKFTDSSKTATRNSEHQNGILQDDKNKMAVKIHTSAVETECVRVDKAVEKVNKYNHSSETAMKNPEEQNNQLAKCINSIGKGKENADINVTSAGSAEKNTKCKNPSKPIAVKSGSRDKVSKGTTNKKEDAKQTATTSTSTADAKSTLAGKAIEKNAKTKLSATASSQSIDKNTGAKPKCTSVAKASAENKKCRTTSQLGAKGHSKAGDKKSHCKQVASASAIKTKNVSANKLAKKETKYWDSSQTTTKTANQRNVNASNCKPVVLAPSCPRRAEVFLNRNQSACVNRSSYCYQPYNSYGYQNYCSSPSYYNCGGSYWGGC